MATVACDKGTRRLVAPSCAQPEPNAFSEIWEGRLVLPRTAELGAPLHSPAARLGLACAKQPEQQTRTIRHD